jgi:hypothetical protein
MNEPLRIALRVLGVVLFVCGLLGSLYIMVVGAHDFAGQMGQNCRHNNQLGPSEWCHWRDALGILQALPYLTLVGAAFMVVMQRGWVGKDRNNQPDMAPMFNGKLGLVAGLAVVLLVAGNFASTFIYRAGYTVKRHVDVINEIRDAPRPYLDGKPVGNKPADAKPASAPAAPRGLGRGSLLRTGAFRSALAEIRRAAPDGARISGLRVSAARIDAEVLGGGRVVKLVKPWDGKVRVEAKAAATDMDEALVAFSQIDPAAPQRVAQAAPGRPSDVDYLVLFDAVGLRWNGFLVEQRGQFSASPDGRRLI